MNGGKRRLGRTTQPSPRCSPSRCPAPSDISPAAQSTHDVIVEVLGFLEDLLALLGRVLVELLF